MTFRHSAKSMVKFGDTGPIPPMAPEQVTEVMDFLAECESAGVDPLEAAADALAIPGWWAPATTENQA